MAFWGIEIKPGKPYIHRFDDENGRLHVSQATLGAGSSTKKSIVECKVGDKTPIYLCSLLPEKLETCALNLEFEEDDEVTFSVNGPHSMHLSGFFYGENEDKDNMGDDYASDLYEGNMVGTDSEDEDDSISYDSEDEDDSISYDSEDEDDDLIDDDACMFPLSPIPNSGVKIEEIVDDEKTTIEIGMSKREKKKKSQLSMSDDNGNSNHQIVAKAGTRVPVLESEDEDGFPISALESKSETSNTASKSEETDERMDEKTQNKKEKDDGSHEKNLKRKIDSVGQDGKPARDSYEPRGSSVQLDSIFPGNEIKNKKKKKKVPEKEESAKESGMPNSNCVEQFPEVEIGNDLKPTSEKKKEKKKKQNKQGESAAILKAGETQTDKKGSIVEKEEKGKIKSLQLRSFPNGLVIEELAMGKPDGKRASPGKKVSVHYIGKLKKNGKIFDSNIGRAPFKFRLGIGQVIKGWDVGVSGMRIGDKRKLTIPPAMGYGGKGCGPAIPPNSWLVFDVELVDVN